MSIERIVSTCKPFSVLLLCFLGGVVFGPVSAQVRNRNIHDLISDLNTNKADVAYERLVLLGSKSVPSLLKALRSPSSSVRYRAARALGRIGDNSVIGPLKQALNDKDWTVRVSALLALSEVAGLRVLIPANPFASDTAWQARTVANAIYGGNSNDPSAMEVVQKLDGSAERLVNLLKEYHVRHYAFHPAADFIDVELRRAKNLHRSDNPNTFHIEWLHHNSVQRQDVKLPAHWSLLGLDPHSVLLWEPEGNPVLVLLLYKASGSREDVAPGIYQLKGDTWSPIQVTPDLLAFTVYGSYYFEGKHLYAWDRVYDLEGPSYGPMFYKLREYRWRGDRLVKISERVTKKKYDPLKDKNKDDDVAAQDDPLREFGLKWRSAFR